MNKWKWSILNCHHHGCEACVFICNIQKATVGTSNVSCFKTVPKQSVVSVLWFSDCRSKGKRFVDWGLNLHELNRETNRKHFTVTDCWRSTAFAVGDGSDAFVSNSGTWNLSDRNTHRRNWTLIYLFLALLFFFFFLPLLLDDGCVLCRQQSDCCGRCWWNIE